MNNAPDIRYLPVPDVTVPNTILVTSPDLADGTVMDSRFAYEAAGVGCLNLTPRLQWSQLPEGTQSIAVTMFDPNAPTGSGYWHWIMADIAKDASGYTPGDPCTDFPNDYGNLGYDGPCPPPGGPHNYVFTVHALKIPSLGLPAGSPHVAARFTIFTNAIAQGSISLSYQR